MIISNIKGDVSKPYLVADDNKLMWLMVGGKIRMKISGYMGYIESTKTGPGYLEKVMDDRVTVVIDTEIPMGNLNLRDIVDNYPPDIDLVEKWVLVGPPGGPPTELYYMSYIGQKIHIMASIKSNGEVKVGYYDTKLTREDLLEWLSVAVFVNLEKLNKYRLIVKNKIEDDIAITFKERKIHLGVDISRKGLYILGGLTVTLITSLGVYLLL